MFTKRYVAYSAAVLVLFSSIRLDYAQSAPSCYTVDVLSQGPFGGGGISAPNAPDNFTIEYDYAIIWSDSANTTIQVTGNGQAMRGKECVEAGACMVIDAPVINCPPTFSDPTTNFQMNSGAWEQDVSNGSINTTIDKCTDLGDLGVCGAFDGRGPVGAGLGCAVRGAHFSRAGDCLQLLG